ncbi:MAG: hypothetical protein OWS74_06650 [Firmicutes bacterium]|nr:hypothetical protein [Bacillota bacterium]
MMREEIVSKLKEMLDGSFDPSCVHVTSFLSYGKPPSEEMLLRGKVYHHGLEDMLMKLYPDAVIEKSHKQKVLDKEICYTPDVVVPSQKLLIEIKSTSKSYDYATMQTSIYRYLLGNEKIDVKECIMLTGDLKVYNLRCDQQRGEMFLLSKVKQMLLNY